MLAACHWQVRRKQLLAGLIKTTTLAAMLQLRDIEHIAHGSLICPISLCLSCLGKRERGKSIRKNKGLTSDLADP